MFPIKHNCLLDFYLHIRLQLFVANTIDELNMFLDIMFLLYVALNRVVCCFKHRCTRNNIRIVLSRVVGSEQQNFVQLVSKTHNFHCVETSGIQSANVHNIVFV